MTTRILVTGDRNWQNRSIIYSVLYNMVEIYNERGEVVVTHGDASGADSIAGWATRDLQAHFRVREDPHPAKWHRINPKTGQEYFFKGAGPERNNEMLNLNDPPPNIVLAFHNDLAESKGTRDCVLGAIKRKFNICIFAEDNSTSYAMTTILGSQIGRPEEILQQALEQLHPLTW